MLAQGLLSSIFPRVIFRVNSTEKALYLTFDDGPTEITPWVLGELSKYNAKATFFCVGSNVEKNIPLYHKIIEQGHAVGNHTMYHLSGWKTEAKKYLADVEKCHSVLTSFQPQTTNLPANTHGLQQWQAGHKPQTFFRPPYGKLTPTQYSSLKKNYRIVMWDVLSKDYDKNISPEQCFNRVISKSKPGSVVVFHDSIKAEKNLMYALPRALEYFSEKKFSFNSLPN